MCINLFGLSCIVGAYFLNSLIIVIIRNSRCNTKGHMVGLRSHWFSQQGCSNKTDCLSRSAEESSMQYDQTCNFGHRKSAPRKTSFIIPNHNNFGLNYMIVRHCFVYARKWYEEKIVWTTVQLVWEKVAAWHTTRVWFSPESTLRNMHVGNVSNSKTWNK